MKLRNKISLSILTVVVVSFVVVIGYVSISTAKKDRENAQNLALEAIRSISSHLEAALKQDFNTIQTIGSAIARMDRTREGAREEVLNMIATGSTLSDRAVNMWIAFEPNAFDGRDAQYANTGWYGKNGRFAASYNSIGGVARRATDVMPEPVDVPVQENRYRIPMTTGKSVLIEPIPYSFPDGRKEFISSLCVPIRIDGRVAGVVGMDVGFKKVQDMIEKLKVIENHPTVLLIVNGDTVIYAPEPEDIGRNIADVLKARKDVGVVVCAVREGREDKEYLTHDVSMVGGLMMMNGHTPVSVGDLEQPLSINVSVPVVDILATNDAATRNAILAATAGILLLACAAVWIVHCMAGFITAASRAIEEPPTRLRHRPLQGTADEIQE